MWRGGDDTRAFVFVLIWGRFDADMVIRLNIQYEINISIPPTHTFKKKST
jgi:hypothetical protein